MIEVVMLILTAAIIGSFLNVVIYRLPKMHEDEPGFNLAWPASHCPHCKTNIRYWQNIPVLSFFYLKGRCAACQHAISWRYPSIEVLSILLSLALFVHFGWQIALFPALIFTYALLALTFIDIDEQILPDAITMPLLWLGLAFNTFDMFTSATDAIWGALLGYTLLMLVNRLYYVIRKKDGMGRGDWKLLACFGAWFGVHALLPIILAASVLGLLTALIGICMGKLKYHAPLPFGPFLAMSAWAYLFFI
jgi:leader peptidase (prepilin peptidase) / N-methyltransferase